MNKPLQTSKNLKAKMTTIHVLTFSRFDILTFRRWSALVAILLITTSPLRAGENRSLYVTASGVHVGDGKVIEQGAVLIRDGKIVAVGRDITKPADVVIIDIKDGSITPGLIDANAVLEPTDIMTSSGRREGRATRAVYRLSQDATRKNGDHDDVWSLLRRRVANRMAHFPFSRSEADGFQASSNLGNPRGLKSAARNAMSREALAPLPAGDPAISYGGPFDERVPGARFALCGSFCPRWYAHAEGLRCPICGSPNGPPPLSVGTRRGDVLVEESSEVIPETRVLDSINLRSPDLGRLLEGGVTTVYAAPQTAAVISSRGAIIRTGGPMDRRVLKSSYGVTAAMGTDPSRVGGGNTMPFGAHVTFRTRRPTTRMGVTWVFRKALYDARRRSLGLRPYGADTPDDRALDQLDDVLKGSVLLRIQARTQQDILSALRLSREFGLSFVLVEATEAYRCLKEIRAAGVPVVFGPIYVIPAGDRARSGEVSENRLYTVRALIRGGIETALSAHEMRDDAGLARQAMYAMRAGVTAREALRAVTMTPARMLGIDDQLGSLEEGKRADLVVWSGRPFAATSRPVVVIMDGRIVLDRREEVNAG